MDDTTSPESQSDTGNDNWQARYGGLQKVLSTRDRELAAAVAERDTLKADRAAQETALVELQEFRAAKAALDTEQAERTQYEALKSKFEEEPPTPTAHNESRDGWSRPAYEAKPKGERNEGFPT